MSKEVFQSLKNINGASCLLPMLSGKIEVYNAEDINSEQTYFDASHVHPFGELVLVLEGSAIFEVNGERHDLAAGDGLFIHGGVLHKKIYAGKQYHHILVIHAEYHPEELRDRVIPEYVQDETKLLNSLFQQQCIKFYLGETGKMELEYMCLYMKEARVGDYIKMRNGLNHLIMSCCQAVYVVKSNPLHYEWLKKLITQNKIYLVNQYIQEHLAEELSVEEIASFLHYTPRHVQRLVAEYYETSLTKMILAYRISYAKQLLVNTELKIDEISIRTGYGSVKNMQKHFRQEVGMSPGQFRRFIRGRENEEEETT